MNATFWYIVDAYPPVGLNVWQYFGAIFICFYL